FFFWFWLHVAMESCGNVCDWLLCGEWPDPGPGLCQEPSSSCSRKDFLESLGSILPLEEQEQPWFYFAGDSTGRQLWAAFLKDVAKINLGNFVQVKTRVSNCPKTPPPDKRLQRFVNANARQVDLQPNWTSAGDRICDWNVSFGQRSVRVTYDWRRFISDSTNDLHVLEEVAKAGRWPTAWVVISGVHDCYYLRRNLAFQASSTKGFFSFLEQHPILKSRTIIVGMEYMVDKDEHPKKKRRKYRSSRGPKSLYNCSRRLHNMMLEGAREHAVYMIPRWGLTRSYADKEVVNSVHYPESVILNELPSLLTGLSCIAKGRQHGQSQSILPLITAPFYTGPLLLLYFLMTVAAAVCALLVVHRGRRSWRERALPEGPATLGARGRQHDAQEAKCTEQEDD
ncbi:unnamed protein product, partial [Durusdinium trenchii]